MNNGDNKLLAIFDQTHPMNSFQLRFLAMEPLDVYENTSHFRRANDIVCGRPFISRTYDHTRLLQRSQIAKIRLTPYY